MPGRGIPKTEPTNRHERPPTAPERKQRPIVKNAGIAGLHDYGPLPIPPAARKRTPEGSGK